ncbi:MAG: HAD-IIB family hydrolase [Candidatus Kaiserbacteria bacterium]|nr:HAD-IIB family hydrolase [Candidatus Kaiserbacteria bacterium]MCB9815974.1 HAD-IIB family hydrolase [Candidatus Nomurabacteria bacterium]
MKYKHLFFDMDKTIAPARQPILPEMFELLSSLPQDIVIVSGQDVEKIKWQSNNLHAVVLGQNGNHAVDVDGAELWNVPLDESHRAEIMAHIDAIVNILDHDLNLEWDPIEDRGAQITFSPIGNTAPVEVKMTYDPDRKKRDALIEKVPFESNDLVVKIGGSTSFDYIHKDRHKGTNVQKLIDLKGWDKNDCVYYGDGLYPGGNDEAVIGVIETVSVEDHLDTYTKLKELIG